MLTIEKTPPPFDALINEYTAISGAYTDSYAIDIPIKVSFPDYLIAFYTTPLFKLERLILLFIRKPSTDKEAQELAGGAREQFAAWTVEARSENQILTCDFMGRTRSWLMATPTDKGTRLYFGSAVVPEKQPRSRKFPLGFFFHALLGFHKVYSILLLYSAKTALMHKNSKENHLKS